MKIQTYDIQTFKKEGEMIINPRYIIRMQEMFTCPKNLKKKLFWLFFENIGGLVIDKKTYLKLKKLIP